VNLKIGHWAPEVYGSFTRRVTVTRYVPVQEVENERKKHLDKPDYKKFIHFDFEVETAVRELGHGWKWFKNHIPLLQSPAELQARTDKGRRLEPRDWVKFCVAPCSDMIDWPLTKTENFQDIADREASNPLLT